MKKLLIFLMLTLVPGSWLAGQDVRTTQTKVADLLARMPAGDLTLASSLMEDMYVLGAEGWNIICRQVVPAGTGDDTKARYAVSTLTAYLSGDSGGERKNAWEKQCILFMDQAADPEVKSYFMRQLNLIGSDASVSHIVQYMGDSVICADAVISLLYREGEAATGALISSLSETECPCAAQILSGLSAKGVRVPASLSTSWYEKGDRGERSAALLALALSGDEAALPVLTSAAEAAGYKWDAAGSVEALLLYAKEAGLSGDIKTMERITESVISRSTTRETAGQKLAAMSVIVAVKGEAALPMLLEAANDPDVVIRGGALRLASSVPGPEATKKWIARYDKMHTEARADLLFMLGERGDKQAVPLMMKAMNDPSRAVSGEAVTGLARLQGNIAAGPLLQWIVKYDNEEGHMAAASALTTVLDSSNTHLVAEILPQSKGHATATLLWLLAWTGDHTYFGTVYGYTSSDDPGVRAAAVTSLARLASCDDQQAIIALMPKAEGNTETELLQEALASAAMGCSDPEKRSETILAALDKGMSAVVLMPVLARTGGKSALDRVVKDFENGNAETRDACFDALAHWSDLSAAGPLLAIAASGNKTFGLPAFDAYLGMVSASTITPERRLLMIKDIAAYAMAAESKTGMIAAAAALRIRPASFFISGFLSDPDEEVSAAAAAALESMELPADEVFTSMFNGKDLTGWHGLVGNPLTRAKMKPSELAAKQKEADQKMAKNWSVKDGLIWFTGEGDNLCSVKEYGDFELYADWRITKKGDSGIYLRGTPQVQIWDTSRIDVGAQVGSGGLYNNEVNPSSPLKVADNPVGEWNTFRIVMKGDRVSVWLNGELVTDNVTMENYWDRSAPIFDKGPVELQAHGTDLAFRDIYIREIDPVEYLLTPEEKAAGFVPLFNGRNLDGWIGDKKSYVAENGDIVIRPGSGSGGNLYTEKEYADFVFRFEFQLTSGANNGLGIRTPDNGDAAYVGMELQILDNTASVYSDLKPYQYHGSIYGVVPALKGYLKPVGEWNSEEVIAQGNRIKVILNGTVIVDADISGPIANGTADGASHPGLGNKSGHIGFLGHGSIVRFRNIRIKVL